MGALVCVRVGRAQLGVCAPGVVVRHRPAWFVLVTEASADQALGWKRHRIEIWPGRSEAVEERTELAGFENSGQSDEALQERRLPEISEVDGTEPRIADQSLRRVASFWIRFEHRSREASGSASNLS